MSKLGTKQQQAQLSTVYIKLLQGFLLKEDKASWEVLVCYQTATREFFQTLGLALYLNENEGYAFLRTLATEDSGDGKITDETAIGHLKQEAIADKKKLTLMRKVPLSFEVSLLCVLLREALEHFDATVTDDHRLILSKSEIYDLLKLYYPDKHDETKHIKRFDSIINKVMELGFIRELKRDNTRIEVLRIIKALIDADAIHAMKHNMQDYFNQKSLTHLQERAPIDE